MWHTDRRINLSSNISPFLGLKNCIWIEWHLIFDESVCPMPWLMILLCYWRGVGLTLGGMWQWFENFNQFVCRWVVACASYTHHGLHTEKLFLIPMTWESLIIRSSWWSRWVFINIFFWHCLMLEDMTSVFHLIISLPALSSPFDKCGSSHLQSFCEN